MKISAYKTKLHGPAAGLKKVFLIAVHGEQHPHTANNVCCSAASGRQVGGEHGHDSFFLHSFHFMRCNIMQKRSHIIDTLTVC
jgi:hypothetical protein